MTQTQHRLDNAFAKLVETMQTLRGANGCPWDKKQTLQSLTPYITEEVFEAVEAAENLMQATDSATKRQLAPELCEELGDVMMQVVFFAQVAQEMELFSISDVLQQVVDKLVRRHPHVFADEHAGNAEEALQHWEAQKVIERQGKAKRQGRLSGLPRAMPALLRARRSGEKAAAVRFDWESAENAWEQARSEFKECEDAMASGDAQHIAAELGDLMFTLAQVCRHRGLDAEAVLHAGVNKFQKRFAAMEEASAGNGSALENMSREELEAAWLAAKHQLGGL